MNGSTEAEAVISGFARSARIGRLVRWAARIASLPVFGLVLSSLVPALLSFNISARDDKVIALGLCGVCLGLILGWRWAALGGAFVLAGVGLLLTQEDNLLSPDPFTVGFGLQGILFLVSGLLNSQTGRDSKTAGSWVRRTALAALVACAAVGVIAIGRGPGPIPLTRERQSFAGLWQTEAGTTLELTPEGRAKAAWAKGSRSEQTDDPLHLKPGEFLVYFHPDEKLELTTGPLGTSKIYHVDRYPHTEGNLIKMVLNGSDPFIKSSGVVLVKQPAR